MSKFLIIFMLLFISCGHKEERIVPKKETKKDSDQKFQDNFFNNYHITPLDLMPCHYQTYPNIAVPPLNHVY